jgi:hypothetical protein
VLTEHGPKLLPLSVVCKQPGPAGFFDREKYRTTIGYAYAGSSLVGLSTHALQTRCCRAWLELQSRLSPEWISSQGQLPRLASNT